MLKEVFSVSFFFIFSFGRLAQSTHDLQIPKTRKTTITGAHSYVPIKEYVHRIATIKGLLQNGSVLSI